MSRPHKIQKSISYALFFASVIVNIQDFTILFLSIVTNSYICDDVILNWSSCKYVFISSNLDTLVTAGDAAIIIVTLIKVINISSELAYFYFVIRLLTFYVTYVTL